MAGGALAGSMFGRYEIRRLLGVGGMGEVYEAYDTSKNRVVALKMLNRELATDPTFVQRFRRESHAMASVQEPHVIPVHDWGEVDGVLYIDMRLVKGVDLKERLQQYGRLTPVEAVQVVEQIAFALDAAHEVGLVHRDVKPGNILLTGNLFAYLVDFGIAHAATDPQLTSAGSAVGSMAYMAPERFESVPMSPSVDTYALTCVLYESLVGRVPFPVNSLAGAIGSHQMAPAPRPSAADPTLTTFDPVIERGMAKRPDQRYASPVDLARAARAALIQAERSTPATVSGPRIEITGPQTPHRSEVPPSPPTTRGSAVVPADSQPPPTRDSAALSRDSHPARDAAALSRDSHPARDAAAFSPDSQSPPTRDAAAFSPDSQSPPTRDSAALSRDSHSPPTRGTAAVPADSQSPPTRAAAALSSQSSPATRAAAAFSAGSLSSPTTRGPARSATGAGSFTPVPRVTGPQPAEPNSTRRGTGPQSAEPQPMRRVTEPRPTRAAGHESTVVRASQRVVGPGQGSGYTHPSAPIPIPPQRNSATPLLVGALGSLIALAAVGVGVWFMMSVDDRRNVAVPPPLESGAVEPSVIDTASQTYASTAQLPTETTVPPLQSSVTGADGQGFLSGGPRCHDNDAAMSIARTTQSRVVICHTGDQRYYYKGVRVSDGAVITLDDPVPNGDGSFIATNYTDGTQYLLSADGLTITVPGKPSFSETVTEFAHR
ncbi:protein kinase [Nocardia sp. NPDC058480]|uniref:serine/threonine-protein kinase n=1 Tax=Nocardia sp. NPDC058480 TaxID=3346522 RepID=UPI00365D3DF5